MNINALIAGVEDFGSPLYPKGDNISETIGNVIDAIPQIFSFGGTVLFIGMLTVFSVLVLIWAVLVLSKYVFTIDFSKKAKKSEPAAASVEAPVVVQQTSDEEIVAVIAAAIAMAESESDGVKFRVVSFKRR